MSLSEFWNNVVTGCDLLARADVSEWTRARRTGTARAIAGFDEAEMDFLPEPQRQRLLSSVARFRELAAKAATAPAAGNEHLAQAQSVLREIAEQLELGRYADAEAWRLGKQIESAIADFRPAELVELRFRTGLDHTGDPGLWILCLLTDDDDEKVLAAARSVQKIVAEVAREFAPDRFPYTSVRTVNEQKELEEAGTP